MRYVRTIRRDEFSPSETGRRARMALGLFSIVLGLAAMGPTAFAAASDAADAMLEQRLQSLPKSSPWPMEWFTPRETVDGVTDLPALRTVAGPAPLRAASEMAAAVAADHGSIAFLVWRNGLVYQATEGDFTVDSLFNSYHMHWLPLVLAVGVAVDEGAIASIDDGISKYLPHWRSDPRGAITVRQLLTMSAGLKLYKDSTRREELATHLFFGGDRPAAIMAWPLAHEPGSYFEYNYAVPELLGLVLERATGRRYAEYLSEKIWKPLNNGTAEVWLDRPGGRAYQNAVLFASARDWLNLGILIAQGGEFDGRRVVSQEWIRQMTTPSVINPNFGFVWLGSPHLRERRLSENVSYYSLVSAPFAADDVIIIDGYVHRLFIVPSRSLVTLSVGRPGRVGADRLTRWDDAIVLNPILESLQ